MLFGCIHIPRGYFMFAAVTNYVWPKCDQPLEPISTLCMLSLRMMKCMKGAKPAVRENWLEFDAAGYTQSFVRYDASSNDLFYVNATLDFFRKNWSASGNDTLVTIVQVAVKALEDLGRQYAKEKDNASIVCEKNVQLLNEWLAAKDALPRLLITAEDKRQKVFLIEQLLQTLKQKETIDALQRVVADWKGLSQAPEVKRAKVASAEGILKSVNQKNANAIEVLSQLVNDLKLAPEDPEDKPAKVALLENALRAINQKEAIEILEWLVANWKMAPVEQTSLAADAEETKFAAVCREFWTEANLQEFATALKTIDASAAHLKGILVSKKEAFHALLLGNEFSFSIWKK